MPRDHAVHKVQQCGGGQVCLGQIAQQRDPELRPDPLPHRAQRQLHVEGANGMLAPVLKSVDQRVCACHVSGGIALNSRTARPGLSRHGVQFQRDDIRVCVQTVEDDVDLLEIEGPDGTFQRRGKRRIHPVQNVRRLRTLARIARRELQPGRENGQHRPDDQRGDHQPQPQLVAETEMVQDPVHVAMRAAPYVRSISKAGKSGAMFGICVMSVSFWCGEAPRCPAVTLASARLIGS